MCPVEVEVLVPPLRRLRPWPSVPLVQGRTSEGFNILEVSQGKGTTRRSYGKDDLLSLRGCPSLTTIRRFLSGQLLLSSPVRFRREKDRTRSEVGRVGRAELCSGVHGPQDLVGRRRGETTLTNW